MSEGIQGHQGGRPQEMIDWSQPASVSADGPEGFIRKVLMPVTGEGGGCDYYHKTMGTCEETKTKDRLKQFLKWSGIAFITAIVGTALVKAISRFFMGDKKLAKAAKAGEALVEGAAKKMMRVI